MPEQTNIPFFRPDIGEREIEAVVSTLRSGWLTTGPMTEMFEQQFAEACGAPFAVAVNSATAAMHLAVEALGLKPGQGVLVPTMTFASTAEVVKYLGGIPVLVDCEPGTLHLDFDDAEMKIRGALDGRLPGCPQGTIVAGMIPVHVAGQMIALDRIQQFAEAHSLWVVEDAAHSFPAAWRARPGDRWTRCGEGNSDVTCFSFYANKTITTGEGGMAVTRSSSLAQRMRMMSLHGLSKTAWGRYAKGGSWDYKIVEAGFKYNLTDVAAAMGVVQLRRAEEMRVDRERVANDYSREFAGAKGIEPPPLLPERIHSWHLYPVSITRDFGKARNDVIEELKSAGIGCSVHWRPLHLHPFYSDGLGWQPHHCPVASEVWERQLSLPIFSQMTSVDVRTVANALRRISA